MIKLLLTVVSLMLTDNFLYSDARPNNSQAAVVYDGDGLGEVDDVGGKNIDGADIAGTADAPVTHPATFSDNVTTQSFKKNVGERHFKKYEPTQMATTVKASKDHAEAKAKVIVKAKAKVKAKAEAKAVNKISNMYMKVKARRAQMKSDRGLLNELVGIVNGGFRLDGESVKWVKSDTNRIRQHERENAKLYERYPEVKESVDKLCYTLDHNTTNPQTIPEHLEATKEAKAIEGFVKHKFPGDVNPRSKSNEVKHNTLCDKILNSPALLPLQKSGNKVSNNVFFSNLSKDQQNIFLNTMLSTYSKKQPLTIDDVKAVYKKFEAINNQKRQKSGNSKKAETYHAFGETVSADLLNAVNRMSKKSKKSTPIEALREMIKILQDAPGQKSNNMTIPSGTVRCGNGVSTQDFVSNMINDVADYNAKMSILATMEEECIRRYPNKDSIRAEFLDAVHDTRKSEYVKLLQTERKDAKQVRNVMLAVPPNNDPRYHIKQLRGEGLNVILKSIDGGHEVKNPSENILRLLGKENGASVTFGDLQKYMNELGEKRELALQYGHSVEHYDELYSLIADEVAEQWGKSEEIKSDLESHIDGKIRDSENYDMSILNGDYKLNTDGHTKLSAFLEVSMPLIKRGGGGDAATFLAEALHTKDPDIIIHALSFIDSTSLSTLINKYGEKDGAKNATNLTKWILESLNTGGSEAERCLASLKAELDGVTFHTVINEDYMRSMIEQTRDKEYEHFTYSDLEKRNMEVIRNQHKQKSTEDK